MPTVNVFIPVFNGSRYILESITSILDQSYRDVELIVVDNCSTDATVEIVEAYAKKDPRLKLIKNEHNLGLIGNFNKCLSLNRGDFFSIICHDDYYCDNKALETAVSVFIENPNVAAVYCEMLYVDKDNHVFAKSNFNKMDVIDAYSIGRNSILSTRIKFSIPVLMRTEAAKKIVYDKKLTYCADVDMGIQLSYVGLAYFLPNYLIANRFHNSNATHSLYLENLRQLLYIAKKHHIKISFSDLILFYAKGYFWIFAKMIFFKFYPIYSSIKILF